MNGWIADLRRARRKSAQLVQRDDAARAAMATKDDLAFVHGRTAVQLVANACARFAERPCIAMRDAPSISYAALWDRVAALGSAMLGGRLGDAPGAIGIAGFASVDWLVADLASLYAGRVSVPLPQNTQPEELRRIAHDAGISCLFCSAGEWDAMRRALGECDGIRTVVMMDGGELGAWPAGPQVLTIAEAEERGRDTVPPALPERPDTLMTIAYTSGSTGRPKGVMYTDGRWAERLRGALDEPPMPLITVCYLPLAHMAGRLTTHQILMRGGLTHFVSRSDIATLFADIRAARPTVLTLIPRLSQLIYQHYQTELVRRGSDVDADALRKEMGASFLGDRLCMVTTGAAPTAPEVLAFLEECFDISVFNAYGSTELGLITVNGRVRRGITYKLASVPELGYHVNDKPYPRGELLVKTPYAMPGYFNDPDASDLLRDAEGYLRSGDIVEERAQGELVWIDRKNNVLRLAQGEFVAVSRLEAIYQSGSPFIEQIYIHGNSLRAYLLAVVVVSTAAVEAQLGHPPSDTAVEDLLRGELERVARERDLAAHEVPRAVIVEREPFSREAGLLNDAGKPRLGALRAKYGAALEALYQAIEERQIRSIEGDSLSTAARVTAAVAITLGYVVEQVERLSARSFVGLGGDSLAAVRLCSLLQQTCGAAPPLAFVLDPQTSLSALTAIVEELVGEPGAFAKIHGTHAQRVRAADLRLERFLGDAPLAVPAIAGSDPPRVVLLTGATGFLGRFLLTELLARIAPRGGTVVCLVRAADAAQARERLRSRWSGQQRLDDLLDRGALEVHAGDLMQRRLGVADAAYDELAERVDSIVHAGALVNHALSYAQLFEPNVLGTVEAIRLALHRRRKRVSYVSSIGVAAGRRRRQAVGEHEQAATLWPSRYVGGEFGTGYSTTKWASEILLRELHDKSETPVDVFRCSMILPHRRLPGQINRSDVLSRLLYGLLDTGLAPRSFYAADCGPRAYDGIPVDVVAAALAAIATAASQGHCIYHVSNGGRDGASLDDLVDWIASSGRPLVRIDDHATWFRGFRDRLEHLDAERKRRSPLPMLERWERPIAEVLELDTSQFQRRLSELPELATLPPIDEAFVHHVVRGLVDDEVLDQGPPF